MNYSPEKQLRAYEFQHPTWFINHLKVSKNLHLVNNATYGFRVLAGCRAFLLPHQISTVARCFETTPVRYMLADEVGLGKTVEACSILSILASENKDLRVLIIVPSALASQWKNELHYKYGLDAAIASPRAKICLLPMEDIGQSLLVLSMPWDLAIVDETHRLLANDAWYNQVQNLSRRVTHILLLSATPIQDRNEEYRRLLALLNPEQYENMSAERFAWMVKRQKRSGIPCAVIKGICDWGVAKNDIFPNEPEREDEFKDSLQAYAMSQVVEKCYPLFRDGTIFSSSKMKNLEFEKRKSKYLWLNNLCWNAVLLMLGLVEYFDRVHLSYTEMLLIVVIPLMSILYSMFIFLTHKWAKRRNGDE